MTRDEIIKLAREVDMIDFRDNDSDPHVAQFIDCLVAIGSKVAAAEREACAKVCEAQYDAWDAAHAIRERGEKGQS